MRPPPPPGSAGAAAVASVKADRERGTKSLRPGEMTAEQRALAGVEVSEVSSWPTGRSPSARRAAMRLERSLTGKTLI